MDTQLEAIKEMAYSIIFNMDEFKGIKSFADRLKYRENRFIKLSAGTYRRVYQIDNENSQNGYKNGYKKNKALIISAFCSG